MASGFYRTFYENAGKEPQKAVEFVTTKENRVKASLADGLDFTDVGEAPIRGPIDRPAPGWPTSGQWQVGKAGRRASGTTDEIVRGLQVARAVTGSRGSGRR